MSDPNDIKKFMAWMDLYYDGDNVGLLHSQTTENGERCFECDVPLIEKHISGIDKNHEKAFDKFFKNFSKEVDEYISKHPKVKDELDKQMKSIEDKTKEELERRRANRKEDSEYQEIKNDISTSKFRADLDMSMDVLNKSITDISLILDESPSNLYVKIVGRDYFEDNLSDEKIRLKMDYLCSNEARESNKLLLFTNCRVTSDVVILIGVFEEL